MGTTDQLFIERDLDLVERWLEGNVEAAEELQSIHSGSIERLLFSYRATEEEVEEVLAQLWSDCLAGSPSRSPLLHRYNGKSTLTAWLGAIALNRWLSLKRRQSVHYRAVQKLAATTESISEQDSIIDLELLQLITASLQTGLNRCSDEDIVLLHLVHIHELTQREVARLWQVHESQISRRLRTAEDQVSEKTLQELRENDPHLDIKWSDFVRLCESTDLLLT